MEIVFINNDFRVYWKGRLHFLYNFLKSKGHNVNVVELYAKGSPYWFDENAKKISWWHCVFPEDAPSHLKKNEIKQKTFEKLNQLNPDIIVAGPIPFMSGALTMQWAKKNKKRIIIFDDGKPSLMNKSRLVNFIKKTILKEADGLWLPSPDYDKEYTGWGIPKTKFSYGFNCINNALFKATNQQLKKENNKIVCVARLVPIKNIERLLVAWELVEKNNAAYELLIIGSGPSLQNLKDLIQVLNLKRVKFLGILKTRLIAKTLSGCDAFILPSLSESWGLVLNEAMAAGLPLLLSYRVNSRHTLLKDGANGFTFDPYDSNHIANTIFRFIGLTREEKEVMRLQSLDIISNFNYTYMANEINKAFVECNNTKYIKPSLFSMLVIRFWNGRNNYQSWNSL